MPLDTQMALDLLQYPLIAVADVPVVSSFLP